MREVVVDDAQRVSLAGSSTKNTRAVCMHLLRLARVRQFARPSVV
ncbi:hypothetical protein [Streptomyces sp. NPDC056160]